MNGTALNKYRERLVAMGKRIQGDFSTVSQEALSQTGGDHSGNLSRAPLHPADVSSDAFNHEVALGILENEDRILEQIVAALGRVDAGTFGRCTECGKQIARERLDAIPYTAHCVDCAAKAEARATTGPAAEGA
jgi:RNA polymerase-binding transcription factor DksA